MDALKLIINFNQKILKIFYVCMIDVFKFQKKLKILYVCMTDVLKLILNYKTIKNISCIYDRCLKIDFKFQKKTIKNIQYMHDGCLKIEFKFQQKIIKNILCMMDVKKNIFKFQ